MIDPSANAVIAQWPTAPATCPHGLALDAASHRIFSAGANGKLVAIDTGTNPPIKAQKPFPSSPCGPNCLTCDVSFRSLVASVTISPYESYSDNSSYKRACGMA